MFTHLHVHSCFSLLDSCIRIPKLIEAASAEGFQAIALTDHTAMYAMIDFYSAAEKAGIHPILGCEVYLDTKRKQLTPIILLCENEEGYKNLCHIVSFAHLEQQQETPAVQWAWLEKYQKGLVALSTGIPSPTPHIYDADYLPEKTTIARLGELFSKSFYIELPRTLGTSAQQKAESLVQLSQKLNLPLVATEDVHLLHAEEVQVRNLLLAIQSQAREAYSIIQSPDSLHLASAQEMQQSFRAYPEAIQHTQEIAERCQCKLTLDNPRLPQYPTPKKVADRDYLRLKVEKRLKEKYKGALLPSAKKRLEHELSVIIEKGFASYFLILHDLVQFCRNNGIPVGPGRGSAAGSLVAFCLDITQIDPLQYGLLFERFLNPERVSLPDIDLDVCDEQRHAVIEYMVSRYGKDRVASIITFGTMAARAAVRDAGKALGIPLQDVARIAKQIPAFSTLSECLEQVEEIKAIYQEDPEHKRLLDLAAQIEGFPRHTSTHAAGIVLSKEPLMNIAPLQQGEEGQWQTQYAMGPIEKVGLLKMDILGLRNLTIIGDALLHIKAEHGQSIDLASLPLDDKATFDLLKKGHTLGVFQMESEGMRGLLKKLEPEQLEDIIAVNALYRPGPLKSGMVDDFIKRRKGIKKVSYLHPDLEPILKSTYGVILYQEQVMQIAHQLASFTMGQADDLRKAMGKKIQSLMENYREPFLAGMQKRGIKKSTAERIFRLMEHFGGYGFNKSHSTAYAMVAYQTAYLKSHYPLEFMTALLQSVENNTEQVGKYTMECRRMGIPILPPDINKSQIHFHIEGRAIRAGLIGIKNVGRGADIIIQERMRSGLFADVMDLLKRVKHSSVNKKLYESLILSGSLDSLHQNRRSLFMGLEKALEIAARQQKSTSSGQELLFDTRFTFPNAADFTFQDKEKQEIELTGILFTPLPCKDKMKQLRKKGTVAFPDLVIIPSGSRLQAGGFVLAERKKKIFGKLWQTLLFSDGQGIAEIMLPEPLVEAYLEQKDKSTLLVFQARKVRANISDWPCLEAEKVFAVTSKQTTVKTQKRIHLKVPAAKMDLLVEIKKFVSRMGDHEVILHIANNGNEKQFKLGQSHRLQWNSESRKTISALLGEHATWFENDKKEEKE